MKEPVRLVIWDLDETFWNGTISEGGHTVVQENIEIVKTLAKRGIISSICSKNDFETAQKALTDMGIWDYFVFPSINWDPKGPRLAQLVENVQLRAPTILFIDDNPMNLNEAKHFVEGLQIADEAIIPTLLDNELLQGKDDQELTRLAQYRLLQTKQKDEEVVGDNESFLRLSDIRATIIDPTENVDRVIELINRTNQLNFTKKRVSEDLTEARKEVSDLLGRDGVECALVRVKDKYGDYGQAGFYAVDRNKTPAELIHFCFSCRTLNMGIETWIYQRLGKPNLEIIGDVLTDITSDTRKVDWVTELSVANDGEGTEDLDASDRTFNRVIFRGGCEQRSFSHFFTNIADEVVGEFNTRRFGVGIRSDHSNFFRFAVEGVSTADMDVMERVGFTEEDIFSQLFTKQGGHGDNIAFLSFWTDGRYELFRHKESDITLPIAFLRGKDQGDDADKIRAIVAEEFEPIGLISEKHFKDNLRIGLSRIPRNTKIAILLARTFFNRNGKVETLQHTVAVNEWIKDVVADFPDVHLFDIAEYVVSEDEALSSTHFKKFVYYRLFEDFIARMVPSGGLKKSDIMAKGRSRFAREKMKELDVKSMKDILEFHGEYGESLLAEWRAVLKFTELLLSKNMIEEVSFYASVLSQYEKKESFGVMRRKLRVLTACGLHGEAKALLRAMPLSLDKIRLKMQLRKTLIKQFNRTDAESPAKTG